MPRELIVIVVICETRYSITICPIWIDTIVICTLEKTFLFMHQTSQYWKKNEKKSNDILGILLIQIVYTMGWNILNT